MARRSRKSASETTPTLPSEGPPDLRDNRLYLSRELSQLGFIARVLELARDPTIPLLERLRFLAISCSILDEFFEIRVAGLREKVAYGVSTIGPDGLTAARTLALVVEEARRLVDLQYRVLNLEMLPALDVEGIRLVPRRSWSPAVRAWSRKWFRDEMLPVLTPIGLDPAHPFPRIVNKSLNFIVGLAGKDAFGRKSRTAVVQAPRSLPRMIPIPSDIAASPHEFVSLSAILHEYVDELFPGMKVEGCFPFRVTRNSDLWVDEEDVDDLLRALKGELSHRHFGDAVRLELRNTASPETASFLLEQFELGPRDLFLVDGPVNLHRLEEIWERVDRPDLKFPTFVPGSGRRRAHGSLFDEVRSGDILLHHPYQGAAPVLDFVRAAASDPSVVAVKMTLYRTGADSPYVAALVDAARAGKEVTAVVELRARFDEAANIDFATQLQEAGAKVAYGVVGYKAHAKLLLVVRREPGGLVRYVHLGTGNYHMGTSRAYTDFGLMTARPEIGSDVQKIFQELTGLGKMGKLERIIDAPFSFHRAMLERIEETITAAKAGEPARIAARMNALVEPKIIQALYRASQAGVRVDLVIRGICCLRPGVPGVSENVRVRSIVGRFLEHSRVFHFEVSGATATFLSSADWMDRNFFRRVETCFPVEDPELARRAVEEGIEIPLADNARAWELGSNGEWNQVAKPASGPPVSAQQQLLDRHAGGASRRAVTPEAE